MPTAIIILLILVAMGGAVYAVIRGLHAFANMRPDDVGEDGIPKSLAMQNKMMFTRIKFQAIAVLLVVLLLLLSQAG